MQTEVVKLTPELAAQFMSRNTTNRPLSTEAVRSYSLAIKRGDWLVNGEAIIFDDADNMLNGQHRCSAVIHAGTPIDVLVVRGVDRGAFKTMDQGKRRTAGDVLGVAGEKNPNNLAAAAKAYEQITTRALVRNFTPSMAIKVIERVPALRYWANQYASRKRLVKLFNSQLAGALCAGAEVYGSEPIYDLMVKLETGEGLEQGDPALVLREKFIERRQGQYFSQDFCICMYVKTIAAHGQGKRIKVLRVAQNEPAVPPLK